MTLIGSGCMYTHVGAVETAAAQGDLCEARQKLTAMLRCAGQHSCHDAVPCSDQAVTMLRNLILPRESRE